MAVTVTALKPTRYRGRLYRKGESFKVESDRTARIYGTLGRAHIAREAVLGDPISAVALEVQQVSPPDQLAALRAEYETLAGSAPDGRWGEARLRSEVDDFKALHAAEAENIAAVADPEPSA